MATTRLVEASITETFPIEPYPVPEWDTYTLLLDGLYTISFGSGPTTIEARILPVVLGGEEVAPRARGRNAARTSVTMIVPVTDILRSDKLTCQGNWTGLINEGPNLAKISRSLDFQDWANMFRLSNCDSSPSRSLDSHSYAM